MALLSHVIKHYFEVAETGDVEKEVIYQEFENHVEVGNESDGFLTLNVDRLILAVKKIEEIRAQEGNRG